MFAGYLGFLKVGYTVSMATKQSTAAWAIEAKPPRLGWHARILRAAAPGLIALISRDLPMELRRAKRLPSQSQRALQRNPEMLTNTQMKEGRYLRWHKARTKVAWIRSPAGQLPEHFRKQDKTL